MNTNDIFATYYKQMMNDNSMRQKMLHIDNPNIVKTSAVKIYTTKSCGIEMREYAPTCKLQTTTYQLNKYRRTIFVDNDVKKQLLNDYTENCSYLVSQKLLNFFYDLYLNGIYFVGNQKHAIVFLYALVMEDQNYYDKLTSGDVYTGSMFIKLYLKNAKNCYVYSQKDIHKLEKIFCKVFTLDNLLSDYFCAKKRQSEIHYIHTLPKNAAIRLFLPILAKIDKNIQVNKAIQILSLFYTDKLGRNVLKTMRIYNFLVSFVYILEKLGKKNIKYSDVYDKVQQTLHAKLDMTCKHLCHIHNILFLQYYRHLVYKYKPKIQASSFELISKIQSKNLPFHVRIVKTHKNKDKRDSNAFVFSPLNQRIFCATKLSKGRSRKVTTK